jgi:type IV secretion system protein TrbL
MPVGILTEILNAHVAAFAGGFDRLRPAMGTLFSLLASIDVLYLGFLVLLDVEPPIKGGLRKLFAITTWAFLIQHFDTLAIEMVDSLTQAGLIAGGNGGANAREILNPSAILDLGFKATDPLTETISQLDFITNLRSVGLTLMTYFLIMAAFTVIALNVLITTIEFYIALAITGILLPFGVLSATRWVAMKPVSYFLSCGIKLMVLAFLLSINHDVLARAYFSTAEPTLREMWIGACCALGLSMLAWFGPRSIAGGIMAGSASLGASDAIGFVAGAAVSAATLGKGAAFASGAKAGAPAKAGPTGLATIAAAGARAIQYGAGAARSAYSAAAGAWKGRKAGASPGALVPSPPTVASAVARPGDRWKGPVFTGVFDESSKG